jgi:Uma2 family endonuclease
MGFAEKITKVSVHDYLTYLDSIEGRAEFYQGVIYDMAGSSDEHALIGGNFLTELNIALRERPCRVYGADSNLAIDLDEAVVMPDVHVVCGKNEPSEQNSRLHTNAVLVVEILSPSTNSYDRTKKFDKYKLLSHLREYVLVEQTEYRVEVFSLNAHQIWEHQVYVDEGASIFLASLQVTITMPQIYRKVDFVAEAEV